jgi:hypothetical protein
MFEMGSLFDFCAVMLGVSAPRPLASPAVLPLCVIAINLRDGLLLSSMPYSFLPASSPDQGRESLVISGTTGFWLLGD